jgi:hypothetical protein
MSESITEKEPVPVKVTDETKTPSKSKGRPRKTQAKETEKAPDTQDVAAVQKVESVEVTEVAKDEASGLQEIIAGYAISPREFSRAMSYIERNLTVGLVNGKHLVLHEQGNHRNAEAYLRRNHGEDVVLLNPPQ